MLFVYFLTHSGLDSPVSMVHRPLKVKKVEKAKVG
jgi:hypothetical protein